MEYIHVKNIEKFHPGYKDRTLQWAKIYFKMVQGDPDCEMIDSEIDWGRLIKFILLELEAQKPIPLNPKYLTRKGFDLKKRPIKLTIAMLHNFLEVIHLESETCVVDKEEEYIKKNRVEEKEKHLDFVLLTPSEKKKLVEEFGETRTRDYIQRLNDYIGSKGVSYKSHYHTILSWSRKDRPLKSTPSPKMQRLLKGGHE